jgi:hypothetical protein
LAFHPRQAHVAGVLRHRSEQYRTSSHTFAHFFRQANGRPHRMQGFVGSSTFLGFLWGIARTTTGGLRQ